VGIAPEHLKDMFRRGFTTKKGGSRGTGLHWCANSVAAMGGRMHADSEGLGRGATMHLLLPEFHGQVASGDARERPSSKGPHPEEQRVADQAATASGLVA